MTDDTDVPPPLDPGLVASVLGKTVLLGLSIVRPNGDVIEYRQLHGIIERVHPSDGVLVRRPDGSECFLPPDLRGLEEAPPGTYRLRSTGEEIQDPDFLWTWTVTQPEAHGGNDVGS
jgi:hypothetical protein